MNNYKKMYTQLSEDYSKLEKDSQERYTKLSDEYTKLKNDTIDSSASLCYSLCDDIKSCINDIMTPDNAKEIYDYIVKSGFDKDGFGLYDCAKELLKIDVFSYFPEKDNMGFFDESDGHHLLKWAEIAKFAENREYEYSGSYEILKDYTMDYSSPEYLSYRNELFKSAIHEALLRPERTDADYLYVELLGNLKQQSGRQQGFQEGANAERDNIFRNMFSNGLPKHIIDMVAKSEGISRNQLNDIKSSMQPPKPPTIGI